LNISGGRPARSTAARTCSTLIFLMAGSIDRAQDTTHNSLVIADRKSDPSLRPAHRDNSVRSRFSCSDRLLATASTQTVRPPPAPPAPRTCTPTSTCTPTPTCTPYPHSQPATCTPYLYPQPAPPLPAETWPGSPHSKKSKLLRPRNQFF
jgi:hypothetical protein